MNNTVFAYNGHNITFGQGDSDVMVNATQMAKPFGKLPADFLRLDQTKSFVNVLSAQYGKSHSEILKIKTAVTLREPGCTKN
jgi:hypothetical protein